MNIRLLYIMLLLAYVAPLWAQERRGIITDSVADTLTRKWRKPLIDRYKENKVLTAEEIKRMPHITYSDLVPLTPGVYDHKKKDKTIFWGVITDNKNEPITNAFISERKKGTLIAGTIADIDGKYSITIKDTGYFELAVSYVGYETTVINKIFVREKDTVRINVALSPSEGHTYMRPIICVWLPSMLDYYSDSYKINKAQMRGMNVGFSGVAYPNHPRNKNIPYRYRSSKIDTVYNQIDYSDTMLYVVDGKVYKGSKGITACVSAKNYNRISLRKLFDRHKNKRDQRLIAKARKHQQ